MELNALWKRVENCCRYIVWWLDYAMILDESLGLKICPQERKDTFAFVCNRSLAGHLPIMPLKCSCTWFMLSSPNACLTIARVSAAFPPKFAQHLVHILCSSVTSKPKVTMSQTKQTTDVTAVIFHAHGWNLAHLFPRYTSIAVNFGSHLVWPLNLKLPKLI